MEVRTTAELMAFTGRVKPCRLIFIIREEAQSLAITADKII